MIVVKMYGGLAGQMTQYAVGRSLSLKHRTPLYIDASWYAGQDPNAPYPRNFHLDRLRVECRLVDPSRLRWRLRLGRRWMRFNPLALEYAREKDFSQFDPSVLELGRNVILDGFWPSYRYFASIRDVLLAEFQPREPPSGENRELIETMGETDSVSVHFRRGDFTETSFHGVLGKKYYDAALAVIRKRVAEPRLFLFSDDPAWVRENVDFPVPFELVSHNGDEANFWDLHLMRNCRHHIVANSGFGWWAAWLSDGDSKMVVAPSYWIASGRQTLDDWVPPDWIRIDS